jgi:hypothetical protein
VELKHEAQHELVREWSVARDILGEAVTVISIRAGVGYCKECSALVPQPYDAQLGTDCPVCNYTFSMIE